LKGSDTNKSKALVKGKGTGRPDLPFGSITAPLTVNSSMATAASAGARLTSGSTACAVDDSSDANLANLASQS